MRILYQQKHYYIGLKGTEKGQNEKWLSDPQNSTAESKLIKVILCNFQTGYGPQHRLSEVILME